MSSPYYNYKQSLRIYKNKTTNCICINFSNRIFSFTLLKDEILFTEQSLCKKITLFLTISEIIR